MSTPNQNETPATLTGPPVEDLLQAALSSGSTFDELAARSAGPDGNLTAETLRRLAAGASFAHPRAVPPLARALGVPGEAIRQAMLCSVAQHGGDGPARPEVAARLEAMTYLAEPVDSRMEIVAFP